MAVVSSSPPQYRVFINFCDGRNVALNEFVNHLVEALKSNRIKVNVDMDQYRGQRVQVQQRKIVESRIALVIFSGKYTESTSCLKELTKINERVNRSQLVAIPIFYKLEVSTVRDLRGQFGDALGNLNVEYVTYNKWKKALQFISRKPGHTIARRSSNTSSESETIETIVEEVKEKIREITLRDRQMTSRDQKFGIRQNLKIWFLLLMFNCVQIASVSTFLIDNSSHFLTSYGMDKSKDKEIKFVNSTFNNSSIHDGKVKPPNIQVFINFRGAELRQSFVSYLVYALQKSEINVFIDEEEQRGEDLNKLFKRIEGSGIAIVVFSSRYTQSKWCLDELVKIKERSQKGLLKVLPIFYKVTITNVKRLKGDFGDHFRDKEYMYQSDQTKIKRWKEAIEYVSHKFALSFHETSNGGEAEFVGKIVDEVLGILQNISIVKSNKFFR